jgi:hypothetical protein
MTISEQLWEVALYSGTQYQEMPMDAFRECRNYLLPIQWMFDLSGRGLRTYMLLVAEALE